MFVLGIESTCDETACSVVKDGREILSNVVSSQVDLHKLYGGVYPELAARRHLDVLLPVIREALLLARISHKPFEKSTQPVHRSASESLLGNINPNIPSSPFCTPRQTFCASLPSLCKKYGLAEIKPNTLDLIAVAKGPGLIGPLLIGLNAAKALSLGWDIPFIGVNHVEAHLYAAMMPEPTPKLPALGIVLSGGHSFLVKITALGSYELLGTTVDDALGEAYDKVASLLGLPYPGGPALEALALQGDPTRYSFKAGRVKDHPLDFSFSGIKTSVLYTLKGQSCSKEDPITLSPQEYPHIAASFQEAVLNDIASKALQATSQFPCQAVYVGGGVSNNCRLRTLLTQKATPIPVIFPQKGLGLDNAAMIAGLGYHTYKKKGPSTFVLEPMTRIPL